MRETSVRAMESSSDTSMPQTPLVCIAASFDPRSASSSVNHGSNSALIRRRFHFTLVALKNRNGVDLAAGLEYPGYRCDHHRPTDGRGVGASLGTPASRQPGIETGHAVVLQTGQIFVGPDGRICPAQPPQRPVPLSCSAQLCRPFAANPSPKDRHGRSTARTTHVKV